MAAHTPLNVEPTVGQSVYWLYEQRGGYGFQAFVPATVIGISPRRIRIRISRTVDRAVRTWEKSVTRERLYV